MKVLVIAAIMATSLAACSSYSTSDRALAGGAIGGASGAAIGAAAGGSTGAALAGGAIGAGAGALAGAATTPKACRDRYGRAVACP
ncbi:bacteriocin [Amorphus orientalis]|uniref:Membrane protein n=1 Tax=Amorphus orientalis TaxID=649198 RepID=A0AAE3VQI5_9HYPH|nr:bacteriocin [Amorphus orientalis]MDQ0316313.1 putative membrane protein [Amorphus orientalis]